MFGWKSLIAIFKFFNFNHLLLLHCSYLTWVPQHNKSSREKITRNNKESDRDKNYALIEYWLNYALTNFLPQIFINLHIYFVKKRSTTFYFHITVKKLIEAILQNHRQNCLWTYYKRRLVKEIKSFWLSSLFSIEMNIEEIEILPQYYNFWFSCRFKFVWKTCWWN